MDDLIGSNEDFDTGTPGSLVSPLQTNFNLGGSDFDEGEADIITGFRSCNINEVEIAETLNSHIQEIATPTKASHTKGLPEVLKKLSESTTGKLLYDGEDIGGGGGSVDWDDVTNKPTAFPPEAHGHFADGITITGTGTTADPFVAIGGELAKRFDYISRNLYYRANAPAGSLENAPVWNIKKIEVLNNGTIDNITEVTNYKYTERGLI
jgi:hypothetical protein